MKQNPFSFCPQLFNELASFSLYPPTYKFVSPKSITKTKSQFHYRTQQVYKFKLYFSIFVRKKTNEKEKLICLPYFIHASKILVILFTFITSFLVSYPTYYWEKKLIISTLKEELFEKFLTREM